MKTSLYTPRFSLNPLTFAMAAAFGCMAGSANANDSDVKLKAVTVSAATDVPVQQQVELGKLNKYAPLSGATVDSKEIEHLQLVNNLLELGKRVPGISMVRNMRIPDGGKQYTENRLDGARAVNVNTSILDEVDVANVDRIDVITGPGSALSGSGALGGTINVYSRQPSLDTKARVGQEVGDWGFMRSQAYAGTSFADGRVAVLLGGSDMKNDGWRQNQAAANQNSAAEKKDGQSVKVLVRPTDSTNITVGASRLHYDYRWAGSLRMTKFNQDWRQTETGTYGQSIDTYDTVTARLQQMVGDKGELSLGYTRIHDASLNFGGAGSGGANNVICDDTSALAAPLAAGTTVKCRAVNNNASASTNTLKKGWSSASTTTAMYRQEFDWAKSTVYAGVDMFEVLSDSATYNNTYTAAQAQAGMWGVGSMTGTGQGSVTTQKENTPFLHMEVTPWEKVRLHLGGRFGKVTNIADDRTSANKDVNMAYSSNILRTGVTYEWDKGHILWANFGETFNPPGTSTILDTAAKGTAGNTIGSILNPEQGKTKEIGVRGFVDALALRYDVTWYLSNNKGFITNRDCTAAEATAYNLGAACKINENAGQLTARGVETMFTWAVNSWLDLGTTYTHGRAYYDQYKTSAVDYSGNSYQAMPSHRLNFRVAVKPAAGWKIELEADHMSSYYVDTANSGTYARPDLFNLRASYRSKDWSFWLHALNLTDKQYATRVGYSTIAGTSVLAASAGQGNAGSYTPFTLRAGVSYQF